MAGNPGIGGMAGKAGMAGMAGMGMVVGLMRSGISYEGRGFSAPFAVGSERGKMSIESGLGPNSPRVISVTTQRENNYSPGRFPQRDQKFHFLKFKFHFFRNFLK